MLAPVTLMGMTLPIVIGVYARRKKKYGFDAGIIYGINTLGAVAGTWLTGLFLLPVLGLWKTCVLVGVIDTIVGFAALWLNRRVGEIQDIRQAERQARQSWTGNQWIIGGVFAVSGAAAMVYEVGWFRLIGLTIGPSAYAFSVILGMFLLGVGFGSAVAARWAERTGMSGVTAMAALEDLSNSQGSGQQSIGISLLQAGGGQRLQAFESMLPGVPLDALLRDALTYQYRMELEVDPSGVVDVWAAERTLSVQRLRSEILRRNDTALLTSFDRWVSDGEAKMRNQAAAVQSLIKIRDLPRDAAVIQNIVGVIPDLARAHVAIGNALHQRGDLQMAEAYYRNALARVSSSVYYDALVGLGNIAASRGQLQQAQTFYERAIAQNPYRATGFRNLASVLRGNDAEKLRKVVERGLLFNPGDPELHTMLPTPS
jgi:tetratricopeptide (TPR) repeat protein